LLLAPRLAKTWRINDAVSPLPAKRVDGAGTGAIASAFLVLSTNRAARYCGAKELT
jgi:hypothetical protein